MVVLQKVVLLKKIRQLLIELEILRWYKPVLAEKKTKKRAVYPTLKRGFYFLFAESETNIFEKNV